jgi:LAS superfamily LD-carboxypeptidase LdcB
MKTFLKSLFIAVAAFSISFVSAQNNTTKTKTPKKKTKTETSNKTTTKTTKKSGKKTTKSSSQIQQKEKPVNAAVDQNSMKKQPAGKK